LSEDFFEIIVDALSALGSFIKKKTDPKKKKDDSLFGEFLTDILCPLCQTERLTDLNYCHKCETYVIMEEEVKDKPKNQGKKRCQNCGTVQDPFDTDDFCDVCGDQII